MDAKSKDIVLNQLVKDYQVGYTWHIMWKKHAKEVGLTEDDYFYILEEFGELGYIDIVSLRKSCNEASICVNHSAVRFSEDGGFYSESEMKQLNKEQLLLQIKVLKSQCEQLKMQAEDLKKGDQTAFERILAGLSNIATIVFSVIEPAIKFR